MRHGMLNEEQKSVMDRTTLKVSISGFESGLGGQHSGYTSMWLNASKVSFAPTTKFSFSADLVKNRLGE